MNSEEIQAIFFVECEEALAAAETAINACRDGSADSETINAIFRAVHSIKGGAGAFGFDALQAFTHAFETLLSDVRDGAVDVTDALVQLMLRALDTLSDHVTAVREGGDAPLDAQLLQELHAAQAQNTTAQATASTEEAPSAEVAAIMDDMIDDLDFDLDAMLSDLGAPDAAQDDGEWTVHIRPSDAAMRNGGEPVLLLQALERLGGRGIACATQGVPMLAMLDPERACMDWTFAMPSTVSEAEVNDIFDFVADDYLIAFDTPLDPMPEAAPAPIEAAPVADLSPPSPVDPVAVADPQPAASIDAPATRNAQPASRSAGQSVRIDLSKLDRLIDSVGELVIAQAMMSERLSRHGLGAIEELVLLDGLTRDIQESAMAIRAQPIGAVFSRVPRTLRELETTTGKKVTLKVSGEQTELDKTVVERLGDPLTHLIRNAVDHGLETPDERIAAGKPAEGTLTLSAEQRSGRVIIRVADDGRGLNRERILEKAIDKGLVDPQAQLSNEDIDNLIFAPGFSTAATISSVSGRGVGMDVVRQNVKELGGRISIETQPGQGTAFVLALPLTLAIADGMIVTVGDQTLVIPLAHVVESLRPTAGQVKSLGASRRMLNVRGQFIPVIPLDQAVGARGAKVSPTEAVLVIVETEDAGQAALLVDGICDQRQFVIKSLDTHYRSVDGVAGATILGDGRVALIADVDTIVANAQARAQLPEAA